MYTHAFKSRWSRCGAQRAYLTTNSQLSCTFYIAAAFPRRRLASSHSSVYDDLLTIVTLIYTVTCFVCHDFLFYLRISYNVFNLLANSGNTQFFILKFVHEAIAVIFDHKRLRSILFVTTIFNWSFRHSLLFC